jgi:flavodoxin
MKQALIIFHSKRGTTKKFAEKIGYYFNSLNVEANVIPIENFRKDLLTGADYVLLGCWTNGTLLMNQKPEKIWIDFVKSIQLDKNQKIGLFTTYKILTGSMFRNMKKYLFSETEEMVVELKSRNGRLSDIDKQRLLEFLN